MAQGAELAQGLKASDTVYTLTIEGRTVETQTPEIIASYVTSKKPNVVTAARRTGLTTSADATTSLIAAGYTGTNNIDVGNSIHVALSMRSTVASASCVVFLAFYDPSDGLIGISRDYTLTADATYTDGAGTPLFPSPIEIIDVSCASQVYAVYRTAATSGTISLFLEAL